MFIDASALTAILTSEQDARELLARMQNSTERLTSPLAIWETSIAVGRRLGLDIKDAQRAVEDFLKLVNIEVCAVRPKRVIWRSTPVRVTGKDAIPRRSILGIASPMPARASRGRLASTRVMTFPRRISKPPERAARIARPGLSMPPEN